MLASPIRRAVASAESAVASVLKEAATHQEKLDIADGPVFGADVFDFRDGKQVILLTAHHLVVDAVSWSVIAIVGPMFERPRTSSDDQALLRPL